MTNNDSNPVDVTETPTTVTETPIAASNEPVAANNEPISATNEPQPDKNSTKKILIPLIAIFVVICVIAAVLLFGLMSDPKKMLAKGLSNTLASTNHPLNDYLDTDALSKMIAAGKTQTDFTLSLDDFKDTYASDYSEILTLAPNLSLQYQFDQPNKKAMVRLNGNLATTTLLDFGYYLQDTETYLTASDFFSNYLAFNSATLADDFNQSVLAQMTNMTLPAEMNLELFEGYEAVSFEDLYHERYAEDIQALVAAITVEKVEAAPITFNNGEERKCKGYEVIIPSAVLKKSYDNMIDLTLELYDPTIESSDLEDMKSTLKNISFPETLNLTVYYDKKTKSIVNVTHNAIYTLEDEPYTISADISFLGSAFLNDDCKANISMIDSYEDEYVFTYTGTSVVEATKTSNSYSLKFDDLSYDESLLMNSQVSFDSTDGSLLVTADATMGEDVFAMDMTSAFSNVTKGKSFTLDVSDANFTAGYDDGTEVDTSSVTLSGSLGIAELTQEIVMPEGTPIDILHMNEEELQTFFTEMMEQFTNSDLGKMIFGG